MTDATATIIDACVHVPWPSELEIWEHLPADWRAYVGTAGSLPGGWGARPLHLENPYVAPGVPRGVAPDDGVAPGADVARRVLVQEAGIFAGAEPNPYLGQEIVRAANEWLLEQRLRPAGGRDLGAIVVATQLPADAAAEIRRLAADPLMAAVQLGSTTFARPFGHPVYFPILEAAAECGLPVIIHADGDAILESYATPNGAGPTGTHAELRILSWQALLSHLASFVAHGVFERLPQLRVVLHGGAMGWLPPALWRLDTNFKGLRREMPWATKLPSEYVREHVVLTTYPLDVTGDPSKLRTLLEVHEDFADTLCFASGREGIDGARWDEVAPCLPPDWHARVRAGTAGALFAAAA
jgi:predicted TIM-barrel fold metal-dependent hydrolase